MALSGVTLKAVIFNGLDISKRHYGHGYGYGYRYPSYNYSNKDK
jgi:tyrosine-protein kinase Etk/Wzc